jgi:hypothetical protein
LQDLRRPISDLKNHPLLDDNGKEIRIYDIDGERIHRRLPLVNLQASECGVLVDLNNIQALYKPHAPDVHHNDNDNDERSSTSSDAQGFSRDVRVDTYPLAFLRTVGNVQAKGIPTCLYPTIARINDSVGKTDVRARRPCRSDSDSSSGSADDSTDDDDDDLSVDSEPPRRVRPLRAVKPVASQMYSYLSHRVASRAGLHDSQQGTVTAAVSGAFANTAKDMNTAFEKRTYCDQGLPSDRFNTKISLPNSPVCCRVEIVYSVDVRALKDPSGRQVFLSSPSSRFSFSFL